MYVCIYACIYAYIHTHKYTYIRIVQFLKEVCSRTNVPVNNLPIVILLSYLKHMSEEVIY